MDLANLEQKTRDERTTQYCRFVNGLSAPSGNEWPLRKPQVARVATGCYSGVGSCININVNINVPVL